MLVACEGFSYQSRKGQCGGIVSRFLQAPRRSGHLLQYTPNVLNNSNSRGSVGSQRRSMSTVLISLGLSILQKRLLALVSRTCLTAVSPLPWDAHYQPPATD